MYSNKIYDEHRIASTNIIDELALVVKIMIMKIKLLLGCLAFVGLSTQAQWQPVGVSTNTKETIYDIQFYKNTIYASTNTDGFVKSTNNGDTWQSVGQTAFTTNPTNRYVSHIRSAGDNLYVATFYANHASSVIYKSTDNGQTFVADTIGLPRVAAANEIQDVQYLYHHNGYMIADIANTGNYWKHSSDTSWKKNNDANTKFSELFAFHGDTFYAWGNQHLQLSEDNGKTWTKATDTNIPILFNANNLVIDSDSGRIYVTGKSFIKTNHRLFYSDDKGENWTEIDVSSYLGNNWIGVPQQIRKIFVKGSYIQLALDNNANPSTPDILVSTDAGASFTSDNSGLPTNAHGTTTAVNFMLYNNTLYMALNYVDVYKKPFPTLHVDIVEGLHLVSIYPNPSKDSFYLKTSLNIKKIEIYNIEGRLIQSLSNKQLNKSIKIKKSGIYFVKIIDDLGRLTVKKVIKT